MNKPCQDKREKIERAIDGTLPEKELATLKLHLDACEPCRRYHQSLQDDSQLLQQFAAAYRATIARVENSTLATLQRTTLPRPRAGLFVWRQILQKRIPQFVGVAAIILLSATIFWPPGSQNGNAWADMVDRLRKTQNVVFWMQPEYTGPDGAKGNLPWFKEYHADPGLMRREYYRGPIPPQQIEPLTLENYQIEKLSGTVHDRWSIDPIHRTVFHTKIVGESLAASVKTQDQVSAWWKQLIAITGAQAKRVGSEQLGDIDTIVFEVNGVKIWGPAPPEPYRSQATLRLWIDTDTRMPARIQYRSGSPGGTTVVQTMEDIRWNVDLPGNFFQIPHNFQVTGTETVNHFGEDTTLKEGVTFSLCVENGPVIYTASDITSVALYNVEPREDGGVRSRVLFRVSPAVEKRWQKLYSDISNRPLLFNFNGQVQGKVDRSPLHSVPRYFDVTGIAETVEKFRETYLTSGRGRSDRALHPLQHPPHQPTPDPTEN